MSWQLYCLEVKPKLSFLVHKTDIVIHLSTPLYFAFCKGNGPCKVVQGKANNLNLQPQLWKLEGNSLVANLNQATLGVNEDNELYAYVGDNSLFRPLTRGYGTDPYLVSRFVGGDVCSGSVHVYYSGGSTGGHYGVELDC